MEKDASAYIPELSSGQRLPEDAVPEYLTQAQLSATYARGDALGRSKQSGKAGGALRTFHAAVANVATAPVNVLCIGDSITEGSKATSTETRWQARLRDALRAQFQPAGIAGGPGYYPMFYAGAQFPDPWTYTGGTGTNDDFGLGMRSKYLAGTGVSASLSAVCTSFDLLYTTAFATGSFTVKIDGAVVTTINSGGFDQVTSGVAWSSGALTRGRHTIEVTPTSATQVSIEGVMVYDGDEAAGVRVWDGGRSGSTANQWLTDNNSWHQAIGTVDPDLVIIGLGRNDWSSNVPVETFKTQMRTLVNDKIKAQAPDTSIAIIVCHETASGSATAPWTDYVTALYDLADEFGAAVIDMYERFQPGVPTAAPLSLVDADVIHLTDKGSQLYSDALMSDLAPATTRVRTPLPRRLFIPGTEAAVAATNWNDALQDNLCWYATARQSTGVVDASVTFEAVLDAGTWTLDLFHRRSTDRGIYHVLIDGVEVGTIDGYAAAADSSKGSVTGITVTRAGRHLITLKMATKNASSTSYFGDFGAIGMRR